MFNQALGPYRTAGMMDIVRLRKDSTGDALMKADV